MSFTEKLSRKYEIFMFLLAPTHNFPTINNLPKSSLFIIINDPTSMYYHLKSIVDHRVFGITQSMDFEKFKIAWILH